MTRTTSRREVLLGSREVTRALGIAGVGLDAEVGIVDVGGATGRDVFDACCRAAGWSGLTDMHVRNAGFLKDHGRIRELMGEMERHGRWFRFHVHASPVDCEALGLDTLVRLGVGSVCVDLETCPDQEVGGLLRALGRHGIVSIVRASLSAEGSIHAQIDRLVRMRADRLEVSAGDAPGGERWMSATLVEDDERNSSPLMRMIETSFAGWKRLSDRPVRDACMQARCQQLEKQTRLFSCALPALVRHPLNALEGYRARRLDWQVRQSLPPGAVQRFRRIVSAFAA